MFGKLLLYFALLLWFVVPAKAQLTIMLPEVEANNGDFISTEIVVDSFIEVVSASFAILWDADIIEFQGVSNINLPYLTTGGNFNMANADDGLLRFSWLDESPNFEGATLENGQKIFDLNFKIVGQKGTSTAVSLIDSLPTLIEFVDSSRRELTYIIENGTVIVSDPLGIGTLEAGPIQLYQNTPNPFVQQTTIHFHLNSAEKLDILIYDIQGRQLFNHSGDFNQGLNAFDIDASIFPEAGTYIYELKTAGFSLAQKMVLLR